MILSTQDKPFFPADIEGKLSAAAEYGFGAFEMDGKVLLQNAERVKKAVEKTGTPVLSICGGYGGWIGDFDATKRKQGLEDIKAFLACGGGIGIRGIVVPAAWGMFSLRLPPMVPPRDAAGDRAALLDSLGYLDQVASRTGTEIYLEPLNRYEDHMINTVETADGYIKEGGFKHVKIAADFYHMNIEEPVIAETIEKYHSNIGHIHLADSHRFQPGTGHLEFLSGFTALKRSGYDGIFTVECRVNGQDESSAYKRSVGWIKTVLKEAGYHV